ncbi:MAG: hypothetical protein L0H93_22460 [Nocardioides sp.]|nr:hypothetical protein [Nocardioides sp.]
MRQVRQHGAAVPSESLDALLAEAEAFPHPEHAAPDGATFALPMQQRVGATTLRLFSTVATFGTPLDVAASELAIETFLPADAATRDWLAETDD